eukprot:COSAG02_NODE_5982_length_3892_cov_18.035328_1_plen_548_part_00
MLSMSTLLLAHICFPASVVQVQASSGRHPPVRVNLDNAAFTVSRSFVSFTMDAGGTGRWGAERRSFWYNPLARALAKPLAPAYFRYGGTAQDFTEYVFPGGTAGHFQCGESEPGEGCLHMNATVFKGLVDWSKAVGWDLIYGADLISARDSENRWDPTQFKSLLRYADSLGYRLAGWELGNEPDQKCKKGYIRHVNCTIPEDAIVKPKQLVQDFEQMHTLLRASRVQQRSLLIGPDTAGGAGDFLNTFVQDLPRQSGSSGRLLDVLTWHFYYGPGSSRPHGLNVSAFSESSTLDRFLHSAKDVLALANSPDSNPKFEELWVGETSSTYGGGTANASSSFVAGFMWLDKLGLAANLGHKVVCRQVRNIGDTVARSHTDVSMHLQVFAHSRYSVIGDDNLPNPDWWSSVLWRRLVGTKVLSVESGLATGRSLRVYAFCAAENYWTHTQVGGVTLVFLNTANTVTELSAADGSTAAPLGRSEVYLLTSYPGVLTSREVFLNGNLLQLADEMAGSLPEMAPLKVVEGKPVKIPPKSYGFIVLPDAGAGACT